jgi:hypothetical protein
MRRWTEAGSKSTPIQPKSARTSSLLTMSWWSSKADKLRYAVQASVRGQAVTTTGSPRFPKLSLPPVLVILAVR